MSVLCEGTPSNATRTASDGPPLAYYCLTLYPGEIRLVLSMKYRWHIPCCIAEDVEHGPGERKWFGAHRA